MVPRIAGKIEEQLPPKSVGRLSVYVRPTVHRLSTDRQPTAPRQAADRLKLTLLGHKLNWTKGSSHLTNNKIATKNTPYFNCLKEFPLYTTNEKNFHEKKFSHNRYLIISQRNDWLRNFSASLKCDCMVGNDRNAILIARASVSRYFSLILLHINLS